MIDIPVRVSSPVDDAPLDTRWEAIRGAQSTEKLESRFLPLISGKDCTRSTECLANVKALFKSYLSCPMSKRCEFFLRLMFIVTWVLHLCRRWWMNGFCFPSFGFCWRFMDPHFFFLSFSRRFFHNANCWLVDHPPPPQAVLAYAC
jgi:hypothetical protein